MTDKIIRYSDLVREVEELEKTVGFLMALAKVAGRHNLTTEQCEILQDAFGV